jgi:hypothetical protein
LLSALTWLMCARRVVMSDPAAKETRAMAQTVHLLDFQPLNSQRLSVMGKLPFHVEKLCIAKRKTTVGSMS